VAAVDIWVDCCTGGGNGGFVDGERSDDTGDGDEVMNEVGCIDDGDYGARGRPDSVRWVGG
jgi:hypothetical protein